MTFGLDLGSHHLSAAWVGPNGSPQLIADKHDPDVFVTPITVGVEGNRAFVGRSAEVLAEDSPNAPIARQLKSALGSGEPVLRDARGRGWFAETALVPVLAKVLDDAAIAAGARPTHAVINVPREFTSVQRHAVLRAADWAGLPGTVLLDRSLAAARFLATGHDANGGALVLVFAVGNSFAEATVIEIGPRALAVRGSASARLGSATMDHALLQALRPLLGEAIDDPAVQTATLPSVARIRQKLAKPGARDAEGVIFLRGRPFLVHLAASQHERIIAPTLDQLLGLADAALQQAEVDRAKIAAVWPVGGCAQEGPVLAGLAAKSGRPITPRQALQSPAFGAALHAADLHAGSPWLGLPVRPGANGSAVALRLIGADKKTQLDELIPSGAPRPAQVMRRFSTVRDDQVRMVFDLVFTHGTAIEAAVLAAFGPIAKPRSGLPIDLQVTLGADGVLLVEATEGLSGQRLPRTLLARGGSSEPLVGQRTLLEGIRHA